MEDKDFNNQYNSSCRVCLLHSYDGVGMSALFTTTYQSMNLFHMMSSCTSLEIKEGDGLPPLICTKCLERLITVYEFQKQCHKTDHELRIELGISSNTKKDEHRIIEIDLKIPTITFCSDIAIKNDENDFNSMTSDMLATNFIDKKLDSKDDRHCTNMRQNEVTIKDPFDLKHIELTIHTEELRIENNVPFIDPTKKFFKTPFFEKSKKTYQCLVCKRVFKRLYALQRHQSVHDNVGKPFECDVCKFRFSSEIILFRHALRHTDILTEDTFSNKGNPQDRLLPAKLKTYKCKYCDKTFNKLHKLSSHSIKSHDEFKKHKCTVCEQKFALPGQLVAHINGHSGKRPFVCRFCNKGFLQMYALNTHLKTHNKEAPFLCSQCGKAFQNSANLRQHMLRHTGEKPFSCKECPSQFVTKGALKSHMSTHTQIRPHVCDICGSAYIKHYTLIKHKRIHTGERPFPCEMCDKRFHTSEHLRIHMRTHTGERPFKCEFCDRAFAQSGDLVKHTRSHVGDNVYKCKDCPAAFRLARELRQHSHKHFLTLKNCKMSETVSKLHGKTNSTTENI